MEGTPLPLQAPEQVFAVLFITIFLAPIVAQRARIPAIIGLIVAGIVIGPNGVGLVERSGVVETLGSLGLLYLMFDSGVGLDLRGFNEHRRDSLIFGATTFAIPMVLNTVAGLSFGLGLAAALIIASAFTSHTPLVLPMVDRLGLMRDRAVTASLGATLLATFAALLVLAIVAAISAQEPSVGFFVRFPIGLVGFMAFTLYGLPRLTKLLFAGFAQDRSVRVAYVLTVLFACSWLADVIGIEPIFGAFLAGLAMNRFVPDGSTLDQRLDLLGSQLLIPLFLLSTGMLIDPVGLVAEPRGLLMGAVLALAAIVAKVLAAWPAARILGFDRPQLGVMVAITSAQAAGALAAAIVAAEIGLVGQEEINAVVLVILITCVVAPWAAARWGPRVQRSRAQPLGLGETVVVPVANPTSAGPLVKLAALVASGDSGKVVPVNILGFDATREHVAEQREITAEAEQVALRNGAEAESMVRIDSSPTNGVLHTVVEGDASCLLLGWKGFANRREHFFGGIIDAVLADVRVPVVLCRPGSDDEVRRVVVSVTPADLAPSGRPGLTLALDIAGRIARQMEIPMLAVTETDDPVLHEHLDGERVEVVADRRKPPAALAEHTQTGDVVILGSPPAREGLGQDAVRVARAIRDRTVLVTVVR